MPKSMLKEGFNFAQLPEKDTLGIVFAAVAMHALLSGPWAERPTVEVVDKAFEIGGEMVERLIKGTN